MMFGSGKMERRQVQTTAWPPRVGEIMPGKASDHESLGRNPAANQIAHPINAPITAQRMRRLRNRSAPRTPPRIKPGQPNNGAASSKSSHVMWMDMSDTGRVHSGFE